MEFLDIVSENDEVIGRAPRSEIKQKGLLHREIHIWFFNDKGDVLIQKRALDKDTYPGLLDVGVGGNVESGMGYSDTAIKEVKEELGLNIGPNDLIEICKKRRHHFDSLTVRENNANDTVYAVRFNGQLEDLNFLREEIIELQWWPIDKLFNLSEEDKKLFVPLTISAEIREDLKKVKKLIGI